MVIKNCLETCKANGVDDPAQIKKALSAAYPFCERKYHPYKIWLDCVRKALRLPSKKQLEIQKRIEQGRGLFDY